MLGEDC